MERQSEPAGSQIGGGHYYFVFTMMKLFGKDWFEKMRKNEPLLVSSHGTVNSQMMSGERLVGSTFRCSRGATGSSRRKGRAGGRVLSQGRRDLLAGGMAVTKNGPNPAGGKVFIEWASSCGAEGDRAPRPLRCARITPATQAKT
jgi:ABC-type Fe3+ transport system substrate-binding protein